MAKKKHSRKTSTNSVLFGIIGVVVVVLGILFISIEWNKRKEMENVKGESTTASLSCNMTVHPARTCPSGYECKQISILKGSDGICMKQALANAGEACGRSINRACQKNLICAPLGPSYRLLATKATEVESTTETETVSTEVRTCIGKSEDEIKSGCFPYIPYYGACVKKGVWPPPPIKPTPTPTPSNRCNSTCKTGTDCGTSMICTKTADGNKCRNPQCYSVESCNCYPTPTPSIIPSKLPDLTFDGPIKIGSSVANLREYTLSVLIVNKGLTAANAWAFYTSQADGYGEVHASNTCVNYTILKLGDTCVLAYTFTFGTPGSKVMTIRLDPNNQIQESNESNNEVTTTLIVQ
jgi:hypothetical protein